MSVSRIVDPWIRLRVRRPRQLRLARRLALEQLENRTALAGGLGLSVISVPAEIGSALAPSWWGHDAIERDDGSPASPPPAGAGSAGAGTLVVAAVHGDSSVPAAQEGSWFRAVHAESSFAAAGVKNSSLKDANAVVPGADADAVTSAGRLDGPTPVTDAGTVDGGQSNPDPITGPSQGGSSGGTNTPPESQGQLAGPTPTDPTGQIFQTNGAEDQVNPGLMDPLAWTVADEQPLGEGTESFDGEDPLLPIVGAGAAGPSTLMDRLDEIAIGGPSDYHSIAGWRANSFESLEPGDFQPGNLRHPLRIDPREDSIAAGTAPWRGLLSGSAPDVESGLSDQEHIAELSPLAGSISLALAATLWSTPARIQTGPRPGKTGLAAGAKGHVDVEPTTASWKVFVMGLDRAFDRSYAEVHRGLSAETFARASGRNRMLRPPGGWSGAGRSCRRLGRCLLSRI